jgi:hypothetical protein
MYYIRTERQDELVGSSRQDPMLFETRREARQYADEIFDSIPSKYGRLIVSEWRGVPA